jgi:putative copper export protein
MTALFAAVRGLHLAGLMLLLGSALLLLRLRRTVPELGLESGALRRWRLAALALAMVTAPLWLALATAQMAGSDAAITDPAALRLTLTDTLFGQMLAARTILLVLLAVAMRFRREGAIALLCGLALVTVSVTSHAAAAPGLAGLGAAGDALHLLCGGFWLGGLAVLAAIMAQRQEAPRLIQAVSLFADWAMIAVALLVLTGMINAATILLGGEGHAAKLYLGVLGAKLVLVLAMIALALTNHFRLLPRLAQAQARDTLKGNVIWEAALGVLVVLLAGLLGLLPPTL